MTSSKVAPYSATDTDSCPVLCSVWIAYYQLLLVITCLFHMKPIDSPSEVSQQSHGATIARVTPTPEVVPRSKAINKVVNMVTDT